MNKHKEIDNSLFTTTFASVVLLIMALGAAIFSFRHATNIELGVLLVSIPGGSSMALLYDSVKKDKKRMKYSH